MLSKVDIFFFLLLLFESVLCFAGFGDCLSDQGRFQESEKSYLLAREVSRELGISGERDRPHEVAKAFSFM